MKSVKYIQIFTDCVLSYGIVFFKNIHQPEFPSDSVGLRSGVVTAMAQVIGEARVRSLAWELPHTVNLAKKNNIHQPVGLYYQTMMIITTKLLQNTEGLQLRPFFFFFFVIYFEEFPGAQQVKDLTLSLLWLKSLLWCKFNPWQGDFCKPQGQPKNN